jgi:small-conductance mechanosensitive channel
MPRPFDWPARRICKAVLYLGLLTSWHLPAAAQEPSRIAWPPVSLAPTRPAPSLLAQGSAQPVAPPAGPSSALPADQTTATSSRPAADASGQVLWQQFQHLSWDDVLAWLKVHGPAILLTLAMVSGVLWLARQLKERAVGWLVGRGQEETLVERTSRVQTLVSVMHNAVRTVVLTLGAMMVLQELGVPIGPLLGGAAVVGLAVAFGAQSLIKDYFTGFLVLLEQQYLLGDVVRIGGVTGKVEQITLRLTVLRDAEGAVHFIPHGQITTVTNLSHGWSRAVLDVSVAYQEDVDRAMEVFREVAAALRQDPLFQSLVLEDPQMLGVDQLGDSGVVIRMSLKTRPGRQWEVKRELLRRIKRRCDELGIEIPFPQRTVWVRGEWPAPRAIPRRVAEREGEARGPSSSGSG